MTPTDYAIIKARGGFLALASVAGILAAGAWLDHNLAAVGGFSLASVLAIWMRRLVTVTGRQELIELFTPRPPKRKGE